MNTYIPSSNTTIDTEVDIATTLTNAVEQILAGNLQAVAVLAHVLMLIFYMILLTLYLRDIPIGRPFSEKKQVTVDTWLTVALQCFGVVRTAAIPSGFRANIFICEGSDYLDAIFRPADCYEKHSDETDHRH